MLKTELEVVTVGTPDITALSDDERRVFFETIMARVLELAKERNELGTNVTETELTERNVRGATYYAAPLDR